MIPLDPFLKPWAGHAVRHLPAPPAGMPDAPLDFSYCGVAADNRWNARNERTLYLAQEKDVALAEYARHLKIDRSAPLASMTRDRRVYRFEARFDATLDLRDQTVCRALSLADAPACFARDIKIARATASFLRAATRAQAIFVPSMAFLDDASKWCLVVFLEKLDPDPLDFFLRVAADGQFRIE